MMAACAEMASVTGVAEACRILKIPTSSLYRLRKPVDKSPKPTREWAKPQRALDDAEKETVRNVLNSERFQDQSPREVYATLLDEGVYHCHWRTMYRILDEYKEVRERRNQLRHPVYSKPELLATGPNQLWSWDITKLRGPQKLSYKCKSHVSVKDGYGGGIRGSANSAPNMWTLAEDLSLAAAQ